MEYSEFSAKTLEEAITKACVELQVTSDRLDYEVIEEGSSGFLGIGRKDAVIKAKVKEKSRPERESKKKNTNRKNDIRTEEKKDRNKNKSHKNKVDEVKSDEHKTENKPSEINTGAPRFKSLADIDAMAKASAGKENYDEGEEAPARKSRPRPERAVPVRTEEEINEIINDAKKFLSDVFATMGLEVEQNLSYDAATGYLNGEFSGPEMGIIIGKRGQTLDSLQYLTSLVINKNQKEYVRVKFDTEEYRRRRRDTLENLAKNIAFKVKRSRRSVTLEPMNPYERRIIHAALQDNKFVDTYSEGDEPYRRVVVAYKRNGR